jgi:hypothetical protein
VNRAGRRYADPPVFELLEECVNTVRLGQTLEGRASNHEGPFDVTASDTDQGNPSGHTDERRGEADVAEVDFLPLEGIDHLGAGAEEQPSAADFEILLDPAEVSQEMGSVVEGGKISDPEQ